MHKFYLQNTKGNGKSRNDTVRTKYKRMTYHTSAKEREMDEFISTTGPFPVSNYRNEVPLWILIIRHSLIFSSDSVVSLLTHFPWHYVKTNGACPILAKEWEIDEFISTTGPLFVSNCLDEVLLRFLLISHSLIFLFDKALRLHFTLIHFILLQCKTLLFIRKIL